MKIHSEKRERQYKKFLETCSNNTVTVEDIACFGAKLMRKANLHPHFFMDRSFKSAALYLTFFSLNLAYEYKNSAYLNQIITHTDAEKILTLFEKRISDRIPVEYVTEEAYYLERPFYVNQHVLVPRSVMNTRFVDFLDMAKWENYRVLDLCAGSGCIGITLALLNSKIQVDLVDISADALAVAEKNIKKYSLEDRVNCIQSDLFQNIQGKYDMIISNPPYVSDAEYKYQPAEIKNEPSIALKAGATGLYFINKIIAQSKSYLNPNGTLIVETGYYTGKQVKKHYPKLKIQWFKYRHPSGKKSILDLIIQWTGYLDSVFLCKAKDLP
jgi:ribosomal protein L3 glutamine methyltransferase